MPSTGLFLNNSCLLGEVLPLPIGHICSNSTSSSSFLKKCYVFESAYKLLDKAAFSTRQRTFVIPLNNNNKKDLQLANFIC